MIWQGGLLVQQTAIETGAPGIDRLAEAALESVESGMLVGVGAGKTAARAIRLLARRVAAGELSVEIVAASDATEAACRQLGLPIADFTEVEALDILIDGADEVDRSMRVLKGSRGAITRERMLAWASDRVVYMVGSDKISDRVGTRATLAVAVMAFGLTSTRASIRRLGLNGVVRREMDGSMVVTDNGNLILDVSIADIDDLEWVADRLASMPGVVEHGLFLHEADELLIEHDDGEIERLLPAPSAA